MNIDPTFAEAVRKGLNSKPKRLSSAYFYDDRGSKIFQEIMSLPEYYLTRSESAIFHQYAGEFSQLMREHFKAAFDFIELGAGDATKTQILLQALCDQNAEFTYRPTDIDPSILEGTKRRLSTDLPQLNMHPMTGLHQEVLGRLQSIERPKIIAFLGSNIGNYTIDQSKEFMKSIGKAMHKGDLLLLGCDRKKNPNTILAAYDDRAGVTEKFNKNILLRINKELGGDFDPEDFLFYPQYSPESGELRSYLLAKKALSVQITALNQSFQFEPWEYIHTEISRKHEERDLQTFAETADAELITTWSDPEQNFWEVLYKKL